MRKQNKIMFALKGWRGLLIVVVAALLVELLSALQYYYTHRLMEDEMERRAEMELTMKALIMKGIIENSERTFKSHIMEVKNNLSNPDSLSSIMAWILKYSPHLKGCGIAFNPGYYKEKGLLYEPYALRTDSGIVCLQIGGAKFDYTKDGFYHFIQEKKANSWVGPYKDAYLEKQLVSYAAPIYEFSGDTVAVLGIDIDTHNLGDTLNRRHIYPSSFDILLTEDGELIAGPSDPDLQNIVEKLVNVINDSTSGQRWSKEGRVRTTSFYDEEAGDDLSLFYATMKEAPHWQIAVVCYDDEVYGSLGKLHFRVLMFLLLAFGIQLYIVSRFARNLEKLKQKTLEEERIAGELRVASQIQQSMLPVSNLHQGDVDVCGSLLPAREVGGDLYDYYVRDEKLFFCIGDVSGKGVPSSLLMAVIHSQFRAFSARESNPARIMQLMNESSCEGNESNMFATLFIGVLDLPTGRLRYCDAGHDAPFIIQDSKHQTLNVIPHLPIGVFDDVKYGVQEMQLMPDSTLFLYTDGLTEAKNKEHKQFGLKRIEKVLGRQASLRLHPKQFIEAIGEAVRRFVGDAEQSDDLTLLVIRYTPKQFESKQAETFVLKNDIHEMTRFGDFMKSMMEKLCIEKSLAQRLRLAVEEAVVNVIEYAYPAGTEGDITVEWLCDGRNLHIKIKDAGVPFDPTAKEMADTTLSAEDRQIGGLGILLVRELMDCINYERIDGNNVLTLVKNDITK